MTTVHPRLNLLLVGRIGMSSEACASSSFPCHQRHWLPLASAPAGARVLQGGCGSFMRCFGCTVFQFDKSDTRTKHNKIKVLTVSKVRVKLFQWISYARVYTGTNTRIPARGVLLPRRAEHPNTQARARPGRWGHWNQWYSSESMMATIIAGTGPVTAGMVDTADTKVGTGPDSGRCAARWPPLYLVLRRPARAPV